MALTNLYLLSLLYQRLNRRSLYSATLWLLVGMLPLPALSLRGDAPHTNSATYQPAPTPEEALQSEQPISSVRAVSPQDTLWSIATEVAQQLGVSSVKATMIALHQINPKAFINNDINHLKIDAVLVLPSAETVSEVSYATASADQSLMQPSIDAQDDSDALVVTVASGTQPNNLATTSTAKLSALLDSKLDEMHWVDADLRTQLDELSKKVEQLKVSLEAAQADKQRPAKPSETGLRLSSLLETKPEQYILITVVVILILGVIGLAKAMLATLRGKLKPQQLQTHTAEELVGAERKVPIVSAEKAPVQKASEGKVSTPKKEDDCTQLELARVYIDLGDYDEAAKLLKAVITTGTPSQQQEAQLLLSQEPFDA